jgi:predicted outer membrane repeat protein
LPEGIVTSRVFFRVLVFAGILSVAVTGAFAATFIIADGDVTGPNGLKAAINTANGNNLDDTIELAAGGTYTLTTRDNGLNGLPVIGPDSGHRLTIHGNGATIQRSSAGGIPTFRIFYIGSGANVIITGLTMTNGDVRAPASSHGGAIYNDGFNANVSLAIFNCTLTGNFAIDYGGAIWNDGSNPPNTATLIVQNSTFSNNTGTYGGAIWNESGSIVMLVTNSTFSGNTATTRSAGAIQFDGSSGTAIGSIFNCTFTGNSCANYGGAINVDGAGGFQVNGSAILTVGNCTFNQNTASSPNTSAGWGGAIALDGSNGNGSTGNAQVNVDSCTFSGNFSKLLGDAIYLSETTAGTTVLQIGNTILAGNDADYTITTDNLSGGTTTVTSNGYNLSDDACCGDPSGNCSDPGTGPGGLLNHVGDIRNTNPLFDPAGLKNNGGFTQTIALQSTSPALDQGKRNTISANTIDQRGEPRPYDDPNVTNATGGDGSDIGAYEADVRAIGAVRVVNDLQITSTTILGHTYEVQKCPNLSCTAATWATVNNTTPPPPISGTGGIVQVTVPGVFNSFYRLHQLP